MGGTRKDDFRIHLVKLTSQKIGEEQWEIPAIVEFRTYSKAQIT